MGQSQLQVCMVGTLVQAVSAWLSSEVGMRTVLLLVLSLVKRLIIVQKNTKEKKNTEEGAKCEGSSCKLVAEGRPMH